jgi:hypothetical protein
MCDVKSSASSVSHFAIYVAIDQAEILLIQRLKLLHIAPNRSSLCKAMNFTHLSAYAWESGQSGPHAVSVIAQDRSCHRKNFVICKTLCYERNWLIYEELLMLHLGRGLRIYEELLTRLSEGSRPESWGGYTKPCRMAKAAAAARFSLFVLLKICVRCVATVFSLRTSSWAICVLVSPLATRRSTSTSRAVSPAG